ncbi:unnamed protein product [Umbelopsis ramanniana]
MVDIFFREVRPRGAHRIPQEGPVIFVAAPHANQFVDPLIVMRECGRRASFIIAAKSMSERGIGTFARLLNSIPVVRPQDLAKPGKGRIQLLNRKSDPLRITGIDTNFTQQLHVRDSIVLPKNVGQSEVVEIVSDTEIIIKREFKDLKSLELLTQNDGTLYKCMPHIEQEDVYNTVYDELNNGRCITIFPEGGSHDRAEMLPLKAGVTLMALGAMAKYPGLDVKIVPCGLNYFHPHRFRSRAVIEFGDPITISPTLVEQYKAGGTEKRAACTKLLDNIYNALKSVTVNVASYETLMVIQAGRRLYKPAHRKLHISQVVDLNRRFVIGYNLFKDEPRVKELQQKVLAYNQLVKYHGLRDHQVSRMELHTSRILALLSYRILLLLIWGLLAFPGAILNLPVAIVAKIFSAKKAREALRGSTVKIAGRDVLATWKILVGFVLLPTIYGLYTLLLFITLLHTDLSLKWKFIAPAVVWILLPFISYASLRFGEIGMDVYKSLKPLYLALVDHQSTEQLRQNREKLSYDITELINEYGPRAFTDFDPDNIFRIAPSPSASNNVSRSTSQFSFPKIASGFFNQRKEWMDDRNIFNWSKNASESDADDNLYFLGRSSQGNRSRSGSASDMDGGWTPDSRNRSRASSVSSSNGEGFKVESMTSLSPTVPFNENGLKQRPIFKIEDFDEAPPKQAIVG